MAKPHPAPQEEPRQELLLDRPRLQLPRANLLFESFFYTLLVLLGGFGALCCFTTAFRLDIYAAPLLALGTVYAVLGVLQSLLPRGRVVVFALGALAWGAALLYFSEPAAEGAGRILNQVLTAYSEKLRLTLGLFAVPEARPARVTYTGTAFAAMLLPPYFWVLSWILAKRKNSAGAFSFTGAVLSLSLTLSIIPDFWALCMLLLFWSMLLLNTAVLGRRHRVMDEKGKFIVCGAAVRPMLLVLPPAVALCMILLYVLFPRDTYARPHFVNDLRSGFINGFGLEALLQGGQGSNNNRIALSDLRERAYSGKTAMRVRYEWENGGAYLQEHQQKDYLKSFVGSVYTGKSWEKLGEEDVKELEEFMAPGRVQNLGASYGNLFPVPSLEWAPHYSLALENVTTNPRCLFTPYGFSAGEDISGLQAEYVADGFLRSSNLFSGTHIYQINAVSRPAQGMSYGIRLYQHWEDKLITEGDEAFLQAYLADGERREAFLRSAFPQTELFYRMDAEGGAAGDMNFLYNGRGFQAPQWAKEPLSPERRALIELTESYKDFVMEKYLQVPEELEGFLKDYRGRNGMGISMELGEGSYELFLTQLKAALSTQCRYTLRPEPLPEGQDFTRFFLTESKAGYCVHFATAAVMLCRSAGIPARYAEGYAVPSGYNGVWIDVPDKNAHAWLEVYYTGTGWVPVEVTPSSPDAPATYYNAQTPEGTAVEEGEGPGREKASPSPSPSPSVTPRPTVKPRASRGPSPSHAPEEIEKETGRPLWPLALGGLGAVLLAPLALWANRALHRRRRRKAFTQEDRSRGALALYGHLLKLHKLEASLYYGERKPPDQWEEIALKARFGREMLPKEDWQRLADDEARLEKSLKEEMPTDRRLYWQYIRGWF